MPVFNETELQAMEQKIKEYRRDKNDDLDFLFKQFQLDIGRANYFFEYLGEKIPILSAEEHQDIGYGNLNKQLMTLRQFYTSFPDLKCVVQFTQQEMFSYHIIHCANIINPQEGVIVPRGVEAGFTTLNATDSITYTIIIDQEHNILITGSARAKEMHYSSLDGRVFKKYLPIANAEDICSYTIKMGTNGAYSLVDFKVPELKDYITYFGEPNMTQKIAGFYPPLTIYFDVEKVMCQLHDLNEAYVALQNKQGDLLFLFKKLEIKLKEPLDFIEFEITQSDFNKVLSEMKNNKDVLLIYQQEKNKLQENFITLFMKLLETDDKTIIHQDEQISIYQMIFSSLSLNYYQTLRSVLPRVGRFTQGMFSLFMASNPRVITRPSIDDDFIELRQNTTPAVEDFIDLADIEKNELAESQMSVASKKQSTRVVFKHGFEVLPNEIIPINSFNAKKLN